MKRMLMAIAISGATLLAHAAPATPQSIETLLALTQAEKILDGVKPRVFAMVKTTIDGVFDGRKPSDEEQKVLDAYVAKSTQIIGETVTMERLKPIYIKLYTEYFTEEEVEALTAFYRTPAGQSLITKMPQLMQGLMVSMPALMEPMSKEIAAAAQKMRSDLDALKTKDAKPKG